MTRPPLPTRQPQLHFVEAAQSWHPPEAYQLPMASLNLDGRYAQGRYSSLDLTHRPVAATSKGIETMLGPETFRGTLLEGANLLTHVILPVEDAKFIYRDIEAKQLQRKDLPVEERARLINNQRERDEIAHMNSYYVFATPTQEGRTHYFAASSYGLAQVLARRPSQDDSIVEITRDQPLSIGRGEGSWLPSVGFDVERVEQDAELFARHNRVSRTQATLRVDAQGTLRYLESNRARNASHLNFARTPREKNADKFDSKLALRRERREARAARRGRPVLKALLGRLKIHSPQHILQSDGHVLESDFNPQTQNFSEQTVALYGLQQATIYTPSHRRRAPKRPKPRHQRPGKTLPTLWLRG